MPVRARRHDLHSQSFIATKIEVTIAKIWDKWQGDIERCTAEGNLSLSKDTDRRQASPVLAQNSLVQPNR